jgi:hypothetical protein
MRLQGLELLGHQWVPELGHQWVPELGPELGGLVLWLAFVLGLELGLQSEPELGL